MSAPISLHHWSRKENHDKLIYLTIIERLSLLCKVRVLATLDHPHIITYYDSFERDGILMIGINMSKDIFSKIFWTYFIKLCANSWKPRDSRFAQNHIPPLSSSKNYIFPSSITMPRLSFFPYNVPFSYIFLFSHIVILCLSTCPMPPPPTNGTGQ
jgi:hypothetical protein